MLHESWYKGSTSFIFGAITFQENSIEFFENYIKTHPDDEDYIRTIIEILKNIKLESNE